MQDQINEEWILKVLETGKFSLINDLLPMRDVSVTKRKDDGDKVSQRELSTSKAHLLEEHTKEEEK